MIPQLAAAFGTTAFGVSSLVGVYYHTYSLLSLGAGAAMIPYSVICSWTDWRGRAAS
jgi:hypothetical protein